MTFDFIPVVGPATAPGPSPVASKPEDVAKPQFMQVYEDAGRPKGPQHSEPQELQNGDTKSQRDKLRELIEDQRKMIAHLKDKLDKLKQQLAAARAQLKNASPEEAQRLMGVIEALSDAITRLQMEILQTQAGMDANSMAEKALQTPEYASEQKKETEKA